MNSFLTALESIDNFARQPVGIMLTTGFLLSISISAFQFATHGNRIEHLEAIKEIHAKEIEELKISREVMQKDIDHLKEDIVEIKADIREMKADIAAIKSDIIEIKAILISMNVKKP